MTIISLGKLTSKRQISGEYPEEISLGILKLFDKISLGNCIFISSCINKSIPSVFHNWFTLISESHAHDTRLSEVGCLKIPNFRQVLNRWKC